MFRQSSESGMLHTQKLYETKQYKKGLKAADSILKKFPEHGKKCESSGLNLLACSYVFCHISLRPEEQKSSQDRSACMCMHHHLCRSARGLQMRVCRIILCICSGRLLMIAFTGETLAMKGLTLNCMDKKKEAVCLAPLIDMPDAHNACIFPLSVFHF